MTTWAIEMTEAMGEAPRHWVVLYAEGQEVERFWVTLTHADLIKKKQHEEFERIEALAWGVGG